MNTSETLQQAVEQYKNGDAEAFNRIYEESYRYLYTCIMHVMKDEDKTMDMLQETYLEISKSISQLGQPEKFLNWAATIANRKCFAGLKKFGKDILLNESSSEEDSEKDYFENIPDNEEFIPESILQDREKQRLIREIIDDLSEMQRLCVIGFYYNESSQEEIAKELGIPVNTVKSHLNRAKAKIKAAVIELDEKKGTRLYSVAPFMALIFKEEVQECIVKPMSAALAASVTATSSGAKFGIISKLKSMWEKASAIGKAKIAIGASVCTVVGVAAVSYQPPIEYTITDETQVLLDQIMDICEREEYAELCEIDYDTEEKWNMRRVERADAGAFWKKDVLLDSQRQQILHTVFYDGESKTLTEDFTGYGMGIQGRAFTLGNFEKGKLVGEAVNVCIGLHNPSSLVHVDTGVKKSCYPCRIVKFKVNNGEIEGKVTSTGYVITDYTKRSDGKTSELSGNVFLRDLTPRKKAKRKGDLGDGGFYNYTGTVENIIYTEMGEIREETINLAENGQIILNTGQLGGWKDIYKIPLDTAYLKEN